MFLGLKRPKDLSSFLDDCNILHIDLDKVDKTILLRSLQLTLLEL